MFGSILITDAYFFSENVFRLSQHHSRTQNATVVVTDLEGYRGVASRSGLRLREPID